jgi:hypothetical protein
MFQKDKTDNLMIKALERFDLTPNIDDNAFLKTMSEFMIKYSWCDYFIMYPTTKHIYVEKSISLSNSIE